MHIDIHTKSGKVFHLELPHAIQKLQSFAKRVLLRKKAEKPIIHDYASPNFHADQAFNNRHSRSHIGPM